jgi:hypothetical protein
MWEAFIKWLDSLFGSEDPTPYEEPEVEQTFNGWIKDDKDPRDQIFKGDAS